MPSSPSESPTRSRTAGMRAAQAPKMSPLSKKIAVTAPRACLGVPVMRARPRCRGRGRRCSSSSGASLTSVSMRSMPATGYGPAVPSLPAVVRLISRPAPSTMARTTSASSRWRSVMPACGCSEQAREHADVGAHAPQRVDRLGADDGARGRVQPAADDVDGQARVVGERHRDVRVGGDDRRVEVVGQPARELERRRAAADGDRPRRRRTGPPRPGRRRPSPRRRRAGARRTSRARAGWAAARRRGRGAAGPASDSSCRSRRTVSSDTRSRSARSEARTLPSAPSQRRMSSRRSSPSSSRLVSMAAIRAE